MTYSVAANTGTGIAHRHDDHRRADVHREPGRRTVLVLDFAGLGESHNVRGDDRTVTVTASAGCAWTATTNARLAHVTAGANGTGNGTVTYSVGANTGSASRTGTLTIAGSTFTVTQAGAPCTFTISPTSSNLATRRRRREPSR